MSKRGRNRQRALGLRKYPNESKAAFAERIPKPKKRRKKTSE